MVFVGGISLGGVQLDGRRVWTIAAMPVESRITAVPLDKAVIENEQFASLMNIAHFTGATGPIDSYEHVSDDPPDLLVKIAGADPLAVELTTMSTTDVSRQRFAEIRAIGRELETRLHQTADQYGHLRGRYVALIEMASDSTRPAKRRGKNLKQLIDEIAATLAENFGVVQGIVTDTLPEAIPAEVARQGRATVQEYSLEVHPAEPADALPRVVANAQLEIYPDELQKRLLSKINEKDKPQNNILLISTGLVDGLGYVMTGDRFVYQSVLQLLREGLTFTPSHLDQVILHHWHSEDAAVLFERPGAPKLINSAAWR